ncbi:hypothetical protein [Streptomyces meridianus]|uniref:Integral membrane protein n=1 Tax=Streptomyces meridianus TaxID=2938945 RepID=A0ABT0XD87_9ACTN|nr:hypothetical protein [Streptomyces meridianus]MCM2580492.1 hypothetical protein [Streptomyces meridianus]
MVRNLIGSLLAAAGATAAVWSPFRAWYDGRPGQDIRIQDLFGGITTVDADLFTSMLLPMLAGALITLIGILLRSRAVVAVAGVVVLGFTVLWMVRQGQAVGSLTIGGTGGVGIGAALAAGGGLLILLGALVMRGRRPRSRLHEDEYGPPPHEPYGPYEDEYPPPYEPGPHPYGQAPPPRYGQPPPQPRPGGYPPPGGGPPPGGPPQDATPPYGMPPVDPDETRTMPPVQPPPHGRRGPHDPGGGPPQ